MRKLLSITLVAVSLFSCEITDHNSHPEPLDTDLINVPGSGHDEIDPEDMPQFSFVEERIDVGEISQGTVVKRRFEFTNVGKMPLLISDVRTTCGCTVGKDWPTKPIEPGGTGSFEVSFDSEGKSGINDKPISIVSNTSPETTVVRLVANVVAPK